MRVIPTIHLQVTIIFTPENILEVATANRCIRRVQNLITTHILTLNQNIKSHTAGLSSINSNRAHRNRHTVAAATAEGVEVVSTLSFELKRHSVGEAVGGLKQFHGYLHSS